MSHAWISAVRWRTLDTVILRTDKHWILAKRPLRLWYLHSTPILVETRMLIGQALACTVQATLPKFLLEVPPPRRVPHPPRHSSVTVIAPTNH